MLRLETVFAADLDPIDCHRSVLTLLLLSGSGLLPLFVTAAVHVFDLHLLDREWTIFLVQVR